MSTCLETPFIFITERFFIFLYKVRAHQIKLFVLSNNLNFMEGKAWCFFSPC